MTIEIINEGKLPEKRKFKGVCNNCGCVFTCHQKDAQTQHGHNWIVYRITCPQVGCHYKVYLEHADETE